MANNIFIKTGNLELNGITKINDFEFGLTQLYDAIISPVLWKSYKNYVINQFVSYQGQLYYSKVDNNINNLPTDTSFWNLYSSGGSGGLSSIYTNVDQFFGNGSSEEPLNLNETISGVSSFETTTNFTINVNDGNNSLIIKASDIELNNCLINSAGGLVKLGQDGLIPNDLYVNSGIDSNRLLPYLSNIKTDSYGNPLVLMQDLTRLQGVGNDLNVILLIQGDNTINQAIGENNNLTYNYNINYLDGFFSGGISVGWDTIDIINNLFQFDVELLRSDLSENLVSIFEHFTENGSYSLRINNSVICYGLSTDLEPDFYNIPIDEILKITLSYDNNLGICYLYINGTKILKYFVNNVPFLINEPSTIYFLNNVSTGNGLTGFSGNWRNLRFCITTKNFTDNNFEPNLGIEYTTDEPSGLDALFVTYDWVEQETIADGTKIYGKINNTPILIPYPETYNLPNATFNTLGGVKVGSGLLIDSNGVLSLPVSGAINIDLTNHIGVGNISIKTANNVENYLQLKSGNIETFDIGGTLFLGNDTLQYTSLNWGSNNNGILINSNITSLINFSETNANSENRTRIDIVKDSGIEIYSYTNSLKYNGSEINHPGGLVKLGEDGKISTTLYESGSGSSTKVTITDGNTILNDISVIRTGDNLTISAGDTGEAIIQSYQTGSFVPDIEFTSSDLINNKLLVNGTTLGNVTIEDNDGYMHIPIMRQIENNVEINFDGITVSGTWKVRFTRGQKGEAGLSEEEIIAYIIALS